jgi:hypothetical protein
MMDFEEAAQRLARDQKKLRGRRDVVVSQKAKKQAEFQRKQQEKLRVERERVKRQQQYQQHYMKSCDRALKVKSLSSSTAGLQLKATSIYGQGDKITMPTSVLESLTTSQITGNNDNNVGNPWIFRIGILNPGYQFPASPLVKALAPPSMNDDMDDSDSDSDDDDDDTQKEAYMDELRHKYLSYTHCTVVEFTQEEGHVGIPQPVASALLKPNYIDNDTAKRAIPATRTVDPAAKPTEGGDDQPMEESSSPGDQTPGHLAWGAFDIPDTLLEISLVQLPKGRGCTLVPTREAVQHNFYGLKDVKLVLEQSLIRSRATLSVGDVVATWHRGVKFDLNVTKVIPSLYNSVTCINTDIEVDIGEVETNDGEKDNENVSSAPSGGHKLGSGQSSSTTSNDTAKPLAPPTPASPATMALLPEPSTELTTGVCNVQIRYSGGNGKRRFEIAKAHIGDLFAFTSSLTGNDASTFRLVTRFPRRVFANDDASSTLEEAGIKAGQELFMVEAV